MTCNVCGSPLINFCATVDGNGNFYYYCGPCYQKNVVDNQEGSKMPELTDVKVVCECGKDRHGFASHSVWCAKGK
jgi:hypothetical protein